MKAPSAWADLAVFVVAITLIFPVPVNGREKKKRTEVMSEEVIGRVSKHSNFNPFRQQQWFPESIVISPDGKRIAYVEHQKGWRVVVNETVGPLYDGIIEGHLVFSEDGKRFGYTASKAERNANVVDGKEGKFFSKVGPPIFTSDGKHVGYVATEGTEYFWVLDDEEHALEGAVLSNPICSADGQRITYVQLASGGELVVQEGKKHKVYDFIESNPVVTRDANRIGYIAARGGKRLPPPGRIGPPRQTPYLRKLEKAKRFVVIDGQEGPEYNFASGLVFSPDGKHYAYIAYSEDEVFVVTDGVEGRRHRYDYGPATTGIRSEPVFSPDSKRLAHSVGKKEHEHFVIVDGKEQGPYGGIAPGTLTFSPDSKRLAYIAKIGLRYWLVVDGLQSKNAFAGNSIFLTPPVFNDDGSHVVMAAAFLYIDGNLELGDGFVLGGIRFLGLNEFQHLEMRRDNQVRVVRRRIVNE